MLGICQASFISALLLHCKPGVKWHGVLAVVLGAGLAHVRRVGVVGTASLQQHNHVYLGTKAFIHSFIQSLSRSVNCSPVRPGPSRISQQHPPFRSTMFSGRDLGTFWPGTGRDEPPCRIQSVIWYLVLHTHPRRPRYYVVHRLRAPGSLHTLALTFTQGHGG